MEIIKLRFCFICLLLFDVCQLSVIIGLATSMTLDSNVNQNITNTDSLTTSPTTLPTSIDNITLAENINISPYITSDSTTINSSVGNEISFESATVEYTIPLNTTNSIAMETETTFENSITEQTTLPNTDNNNAATSIQPNTEIITDTTTTYSFTTFMSENDTTHAENVNVSTIGTSASETTEAHPTTEQTVLSSTGNINTTTISMITTANISASAATTTTTTIIITSASTAPLSTNILSSSSAPTTTTSTSSSTTTTSTSSSTTTTTFTTTPLTFNSSISTISEAEITFQSTTTELTTYSSATSATTSSFTTTTTTTPYTPNACNSSSLVTLDNGTCVLNSNGQGIAFDILTSRNASSKTLANALSLYIQSITNQNGSYNTNKTLSVKAIDDVVSTLDDIIITPNLTSSFLMVQQVNQSNDTIVVGARFQRAYGGAVITNTSKIASLNNSDVSTAAFVAEESLVNVKSLNMLIIDKPSTYRNLDNSSNKSVASSVIVAAVRGNTSPLNPMNISLYFQVLPEYQPNVAATYLCSFYDTINSRWSESGCTTPQYNAVYDRYECSCNHLTSFALIWLPNIPQPNYLTPQDIASLVFLAISIFCFIAVIIYNLTIRLRNPMMSLAARDLLPLVSSASTTILFIFYIALSMTVYTRISSTSSVPTPCFTSASVLMFFVYFFLIFMFCVKTSVGYFNYLRFVYLFPEPSFRRLVVLLTISFFISITWTSFAAGFNSNSSYNITQLYGNKLCWFTRDVIYYFVTIPVGIFLLLNFLTIILVGKHIIHHVRRATSPHQSYERVKRSVFILLSSCITQGIGWLFGPFISFISPTAADVLGWFFVVFNGLEGLWTILLYIIIRSQYIDERIRINAHRKLTKTTTLPSATKGKEGTLGLSNISRRRF